MTEMNWRDVEINNLIENNLKYVYLCFLFLMQHNPIISCSKTIFL